MVYLFDIDGVLIHYDNYSLAELKKGKNIDIEKIMEEYYRSAENIECDKGKKDIYEEIEPYLNRFGWERGPKEYFESIWDYEKRFIDRNLMSKIEKLKNSNKLFITSNQNIHRKKFLISELNLDTNFEECFFSCDIGFVKGENEYWEYLTEYIKKRDLESEEIIFLDDLIDNINIARSNGFNSLHITSKNQIMMYLDNEIGRMA